MFLSIIIPMYNREKLIGRCLDSILEQNSDDIEIICVDDASEDQTTDVVKQYMVKYHNIILVENERNKGAGHARNKGIEFVNGDYIWFVDSDDYICEGAIARLKEYIINEKIDVLCFDSLKINDVGEVIISRELDCVGKICSGQELFYAFSKTKSMRATVWSQIYSNKYIRRVQCRFTEGYVIEDAYFSLKALLLATTAMYIQENLYVYQMSEISVTTSAKRLEYFKGSFIAYCDMWEFWYFGKWSECISENLVKYIFRYFRFAKKYFDVENQSEIENWVTEQNEHVNKQYGMFKEQIIGNYYVGNIEESKLKKIKEAPYIYVYGAGNVTYELIPMLDSLEKQILAYIVSDSTVNNKRTAFYGVPVVKIGALEEKRSDALVIIATLPKYYGEIEKTLMQYGFNNILRLLD